MATANPRLIAALRRAANKISKTDNYQWGHMGSCNCGHLAQELTTKTPTEIHQLAMQRSGDWNDQCVDYCTDSGMPFDELISELLSAGLLLDDLMKLERLADDNVLYFLKGGKRHLKKNSKDDVVDYMIAWADKLETEWLQESPKVDLSRITQKAIKL